MSDRWQANRDILGRLEGSFRRVRGCVDQVFGVKELCDENS